LNQYFSSILDSFRTFFLRIVTKLLKEGEMKIFLVRHGEAVSKNVDPERCLSDYGRKDLQKLASFLMQHQFTVREIWHSVKLRARQTAEILSSAITPEKDLVQMEGLKPNDPISPIRKKIQKFQGDLMIVGHLPFMDKMIADLLTGDEINDILTFPTGGIACLENDMNNRWQLLWFLEPNLIL
jgi:phosphohistidine phosphatase